MLPPVNSLDLSPPKWTQDVVVLMAWIAGP